MRIDHMPASRRGFLGFLALFFLLKGAFASWSVADEPLRLRVLSYNIHHGEGVDGKLDLERIASVITAVRPDVVALQEVDYQSQRTGGVDQPAELARLTGMKVVFGKNIDLQGGGYGNAVLSRFPIMRHENRLLPSFDEGEQRGVLFVEVQPTGAKTPILLLATHFDHRPPERERLASARRIQEWMTARHALPALLAGDLNAPPESQTMDAVREFWTPANLEELPTIPVGRPRRQIDYILFQPQDRWKTVEVRVLDEAVASDHRPIFAVLKLHSKDE